METVCNTRCFLMQTFLQVSDGFLPDRNLEAIGRGRAVCQSHFVWSQRTQALLFADGKQGAGSVPFRVWAAGNARSPDVGGQESGCQVYDLPRVTAVGARAQEIASYLPPW